jgi:hypothetical protein
MHIEESFRNLYGKPCWHVNPGYGSFLTLEFGEPHLEIREPIVAAKSVSARVRRDLARRAIYIHGEWHLWIYCCNWEVLSGSKCIGDGATRAKMRRAAEFLDGQALTGFSMSLQDMSCTFKFDLGATLKTWPYDDDSEQWMLFEPSHMVLSVRADGYYKHTRSDIPENSEEWKPISRGGQPVE